MAARKRKVARRRAPTKIMAWSFSRWDTYVSCPRKAFFAYVEKLATTSNRAMERGSEIHKAAEQFIKREIDVVHPELVDFEEMLQGLRDHKSVHAEADWCFDAEWVPTGWFDDDAWCRARVDVVKWDPDDGLLTISDWKTGKPYPPKHEKQMELYGLAGLLKYPEAEDVLVEMVYTDAGEVHELEFKPDDEERLKAIWGQRTEAMLNDTTYKPKPGKACRWCDFGQSKGGPCKEEQT